MLHSERELLWVGIRPTFGFNVHRDQLRVTMLAMLAHDPENRSGRFLRLL